MTDKKEFSLDISVDPAAGLKPLPGWIAFDLCKPYPVPGGNVLLHNTRNGKRAMVKTEVYTALVACNDFQTLDTHANNIAEHNPVMQGQQDDIRKVLKLMLDNGIMRSAKTFINGLKPEHKTESETNHDTKPVVAIITWERPEALERLLTSIVANCDTGKFHCLYVIDDSRKDENIRKNQLLVSKFTEKVDSSLHYFGQAEQQSFIDALVKRLPGFEKTIRFLVDQSLWVDHWTSGLARNWATFLSCGHHLVVMDDDVICDVYNPPNLKPNITLSSAPRENDFFADEAEWAYLHQDINPDPVDRHMQCLGLSLSDAIDVLGQQHLKPAGLKDTTSLQASELQADSPVLITESGSLGCPGTENNTWLPSMNRTSLKKMLASGKKTTYALNTRKVWSGRNQPHFSPYSNMSQITGLDNRQMLPPYLPIGRGEDGLFACLVDFIFPSSVTLDYPWAVPHLPLPDREWRYKDLDFTPQSSFPMFFHDVILKHKSSCHSETTQNRLASLATRFKDLAGTSSESLTVMYKDNILQNSSKRLNQLDSLLASAESAPVDWQNYLRNGIRQLNVGLDAASREDFPVKGFLDKLEGEQLIVFWKETWVGFAEALVAWPEIRRAASELVAEESTH